MKLKGLIILISSLKSYSPKKERLPQPWNKANHKVELIPSWKGSGRAVCPAPVCIHSSVIAHQSPPKDAAKPAKHISTRTGSCDLVTQRGITARSCTLHFKNLLKIVPVKQLTCGECHILQGTSFQAFPWNTRTSACGFRVNSEERRGEMMLHRAMQQHLVLLMAFFISPSSLGLHSALQVPLPALSGMRE